MPLALMKSSSIVCHTQATSLFDGKKLSLLAFIFPSTYESTFSFLMRLSDLFEGQKQE